LTTETITKSIREEFVGMTREEKWNHLIKRVDDLSERVKILEIQSREK